MHIIHRTLAATTLAACLVLPATAQSSSSGQDSRSRSPVRDADRWRQQDQQRQRSAQRQGMQQDQRGRSMSWQPEAVTIIGYDLDRDGRTDAWYQVTTYELDQMRRDQARSQGQPTRGRIMGQPMHNTDRRMGQGMTQGSRSAQLQRFSGTLQDITSFTFANDGQKHLVGRMKMDNGKTLPVHFGLKSNLVADLQKGDRITVVGSKGRLNDRSIVIARRVTAADGGQYNIDGASDGNLRRFSGRVLGVEPVSLNQGGESLLARVQLDSGEIATIALGPRNAIKQAGLKVNKGTDVKILGERTSVEGRPVILGKHLCVDDESVRVSPSRQRLINSQNLSQAYSRLRQQGMNSSEE